jgi:hypothetical protein
LLFRSKWIEEDRVKAPIIRQLADQSPRIPKPQPKTATLPQGNTLDAGAFRV